MNGKEFIDDLINRVGKKCMICGREGVPLEIHHIFPISQGGKSEIANLIVVCPNCNREINLNPEIREIDFLNYLVRLLEKNSDFRNVKSGVKIYEKKSYIADIIAEEKIDGQWKKLIIETKGYSSFTKERVNNIILQLRLYREKIGHTRLVFAFPGELPAETIALLHRLNIEIWDLSYISNKFKKEIPHVYHPIIQSRLLMFGIVAKKISPEQQLINELKSCTPGKKDWPKYQQLVGRILQKLFCPPLSNPISQSSDAYGTNIRDFILPNYSEEGFWAFLQKQYSAYYIVVDAKNYSREVKKNDILQITNYLKKQGAGLFGIIICRNQEDKNSLQTRREKWLMEEKLIVILTDGDIEQMLLTKSRGGNPEDIIKQKIEDFRLSI